jgi:hypothetical protein
VLALWARCRLTDSNKDVADHRLRLRDRHRANPKTRHRESKMSFDAFESSRHRQCIAEVGAVAPSPTPAVVGTWCDGGQNRPAGSRIRTSGGECWIKLGRSAPAAPKRWSRRDSLGRRYDDNHRQNATRQQPYESISSKCDSFTPGSVDSGGDRQACWHRQLQVTTWTPAAGMQAGRGACGRRASGPGSHMAGEPAACLSHLSTNP